MHFRGNAAFGGILPVWWSSQLRRPSQIEDDSSKFADIIDISMLHENCYVGLKIKDHGTHNAFIVEICSEMLYTELLYQV